MNRSEVQSQVRAMEQELTEATTRLGERMGMLQRLSEELNVLSAFFEQRYASIDIQEQLPEALKDKLQNRLEGIRLSVKTASRLQRKLNLESLGTGGQEEGESSGSPSGFVVWEALQAALEPHLPSAHDGKGKAAVHADAEQPKSEAVAGLSDTGAEQSEAVADSAGNATDSAENATGSADAVLSADAQETVERMLQGNREAIAHVQQQLEACEKKFTSFIEKALAPVMDGLYNGNSYAGDLLLEVETLWPEHTAYVQQWLAIYNELMARIEQLLEQFSIGLLVPVRGEVFNEQEHEPLGVVAEPTLENEQIGELIRYGYYSKMLLYRQERFIIRPAQVMVVKNPVPAADQQEQAREGGGADAH